MVPSLRLPHLDGGLARLVLLCCAAGSVAALAVAGRAARTQATPRPEDPPKAFSHGDHVPAVWFTRGASTWGESNANAAPYDKLEVARDCRGCHDFGERNAAGVMTRAPRSPLETCTVCHYGGVLVPEIQPGFEQGLRAGRGSLSKFDHLDHDALACRACHASMSKADLVDLPGLTGVPACVECHTEGKEDRAHEVLAGRTIDRTKIRAGFLAWLDADPSMSAPDRGPYPHDKHVPEEKRLDQAACSACHSDVRVARADDLHLHEYTAGACAECHIQANAPPVTVARAPDARTSVAALTFSHADHLRTGLPPVVGATSPGGRETVETQGCLACHAHSDGPVRAPDGTPLPPTYIVRDDRSTYAGCISCHDVPRFRAPNHGEWGNCVGCHTFGQGDFATLRPRTTVERATVGEVRFLMPLQRHPGIAEQPDQACAKCHRAPVPATPSRIAGQRFEHASHLGPEPTMQDCQVCHPGILSAEGPAGIGLAWNETSAGSAPASQLLTFDLDSCGSCHAGIQLDPTSLSRGVRRDVPTFSHAAHLASSIDPRTGRPVTCASCHDFRAGVRGAAIGVNEAALTCVQCHEHDEAHAPWTGEIFGDAVKSCAECHSAGLPAIDAQLPVQRARIALRGAQHHPRDRGCFECHQEEEPGRLEPVTAVLAGFPAPTTSPHRAGNPSGDPVYPPGSCSVCHWAIRRNDLESDKRVTALTRESFGNDLDGFPGGEARPR